VNNGSD